MNCTRRIMAGWVAGVAMLGGADARAETAAGNGWQFEVTPYFWGASLNGTLAVQDVEADLDAEFEDIFENLDSAFMGTLELRRGRWGFLLDGIYFKLADEGAQSWQGPGGIGSATGELEATSTMHVYQLALGYRVSEEVAVDVIAGARYTQLDTELDLTVTTGGLLPGGARRVRGDEDWWDPVIGIRFLIPFGEHWTGVLYADYGGFGVGSDATYQVIAGVNWQFAKHLLLKAGYRYLYQDYEDDDEGFKWDMAAHGPYLGLGIRF
jgi:opacity protein-like surface antigen